MRIRALLETTLGWLNDEGYRHLIRCRLAQAALEENEFEVAEGWLKECDVNSEVLELDSASRLIRAWLACRKQKADEVLEILGDEGAALPIVSYLQNEAQRLRVDAYESLHRSDAADRGFSLLAQANGIDAESECFSKNRLALETVRRAQCVRLAEVTDRRISNYRKKIAELGKRREQYTAYSATKPLRRVPLYALALAFCVWLVRCSYSVDPLGGAYGYVLCPKVCSECQGPARAVTEWVVTGPGEASTNGPQYFCQTPNHPVTGMSVSDLTRAMSSLSQQELGAFSAFSATFVVLLVGLLPIGALQSVRRAFHNKTQYDAVSRELHEAAERLGEPAPKAPHHLVPSLFMTGIVLGLTVCVAVILTLSTV
jgi:hypothetical protein